MAAHAQHPIAVFHEHPHWFAPLFAELDRRGLPYRRVDVRPTPSIPPSARRRIRWSSIARARRRI